MRPDYPIKTDRLLLRPFTPADLDDVHAYRRLPEVARYLYDEALTRDETAEKLLRWSAMDELTGDGQSLALAAVLDGTVIGEVDIKWLSREHAQGELGYIFNPEFQGRGYAREAAEQMLHLAFEQVRLHRVIAQCDPRNEPSWRLMERLGMRREAHFRQNEVFKGEWGDLFVYAMLAEEHRNEE
ncbi:GNAT family N-acetyltransferase [Lentzea sp. NPDC042327]|uniref:GNAT family N-acetyltransferase n=1 Tax=Lentzea sp. NPDC042327 TaxID=3154801 RepID=UPI003401B123